MPVETKAPAAPPETGAVAGSGTAPQSPPAEAAPELDPNVKAQLGRIASMQAELERERTARSDLEGRMRQLEEDRQNERQGQYEAYLNSLPPDEREKEELKARVEGLEARLAVAKPRESAPNQSLTPEQIQAAFREKSQQLCDQINAQHGLTGSDAIRPDTPGIDITTPATFTSTARAIAVAVANGRSSATQEGPDMPGKKTELDAAQIAKDVEARLRAEMGFDGPLSAPAAAQALGVNTSPTDILSVDNIGGTSPRQRSQALREHATAVQKAVAASAK